MPNTLTNGLATTTTLTTTPNNNKVGPIKTSKINKLTKKSIPYQKKQNVDSNSQSDQLVSPVTRSKSETSIKLIGLEKLVKPFDIVQATSNLKTKNDDDDDFNSSLYYNKVENLKLFLNVFEEIFSKINGNMIIFLACRIELNAEYRLFQYFDVFRSNRFKRKILNIYLFYF